MENKVIGERIKAAREKKGMSQSALGREIGVAQEMICQIEKGVRKTPTDKFPLLADALDVSIDYLYGR